MNTLSLGYKGLRESAQLVLILIWPKILTSFDLKTDPYFCDVKWLITTVNDGPLTQITFLHVAVFNILTRETRLSKFMDGMFVLFGLYEMPLTIIRVAYLA